MSSAPTGAALKSRRRLLITASLLPAAITTACGTPRSTTPPAALTVIAGKVLVMSYQ